MRLYTKTFVNPLLALAFKDGMEFVADPDYKVMEPKQEGPNKWTVLIEHDDPDEDDDDGVVIHITEPEENPAKPPMNSLDDYKNKLNKMKPVAAKSAPGSEIIHPPVKVDDSKKKNITVTGNPLTTGEPIDLPPPPCGACIPCKNNEDCIRLIEFTLRAQPGFRGER